jgi:hypothetical protein
MSSSGPNTGNRSSFTTFSYSGTSGPNTASPTEYTSYSYSGTTIHHGDSPVLGGITGPGAYSPADFLDAQELQPLGAAFDIGGHGSSTPYSNAVNSMIHKQTEEMKGRASALLHLPSGWKRRLREFLSTKNNELLDFMKLSVPSHNVIGPGEILLRRFGNPQVTPNHVSVRDIVMDISGAGEKTLEELNSLLDQFKSDGNLTNYANQTRVIFDEYKAAGEEVLRQQTAVKIKLDKLDRIQSRISGILEIEPNEKYLPLMETVEEYIKKLYTDCNFEDDYKKLMDAYRRFASLRDVVTMARTILSHETEPLCSICLNETIAFAITPCGHTLCQTCIRKQSNQCFFCRGPIRDKIKLYFT